MPEPNFLAFVKISRSRCQLRNSGFKTRKLNARLRPKTFRITGFRLVLQFSPSFARRLNKHLAAPFLPMGIESPKPELESHP